MTNQRLLEEVAQKAAKFIEADSADIQALFNDRQFIEELGYSPETLMSLFIPNTYEFFWNTNAKEFMERMVKEHEKFWNKDDRLAKAKLKENDSCGNLYNGVYR